MSNGRGYDRPASYTVLVEGQIDASWSALLEGFQIMPLGGDLSQLSGRVVDQAALHGLLARVAELGLVLVGLQRTGCPDRRD